MSETLIEKDIIGYGPGSSFAGTLMSTPLKPRSVRVFGDYGTSVVSGVDNGSGSIVGVGLSGTVNYSTGEISLTFINPIPSGNQIYSSYYYFEFGVKELNKVQFLQQDFQTTVEGLKTFLRDNYRSEYNDYISASMGMALVDIIAYGQQNLAWYLNRRITDLYFPTAKSPNAIAKIARMLGYKALGATGSIATLIVQLEEGPYTFPVKIVAPFAFQGPNSLQFEYRGSVPIVFAPGETEKTIDVYEGQTVTESFISNGETNQVFELLRVPSGKYVGRDSIKVFIDGVEWTEESIIPFQAEKYFESNIVSYPPTITFGDGVQGLVPDAGASIEVSYVIVSGFAGRVVAGSIDDVVNSLVANFETIPLLITQPNASAGGDDPEDNRSITINAPKFQATQDRAVTKPDYDFLVSLFPNVAKADAMVIRGVAEDVTISGFLSQMAQLVSQLRLADRYLTPRPKVVKITFSEDLFLGNSVSVDIDSVTVTQAFDTDNSTTLNALAAKIQLQPNVESAVVASCDYGNVISVTGIANQEIVVSNLVITADTAPNVAKTEVSTAPSQVWRLVYSKDFFYGNKAFLTYNSIPIAIPFDTDSTTTLNAIADALAGFAESPEASINETQSAPNQEHEIVFNKAFFLGNVIKFYVMDLSQSDPVNTLVQVSFNTDQTTTFADCKTALEKLSFVDSVTADVPNRKLTVATYPYRPQEISNETKAFGDASTTSFAFSLINGPIKPGTLKIKAGSVTAVDNGAGGLTGSGVAPGSTITYATGAVVLNLSSAPAVGTEIYANYLYSSALVTLEFTKIEVTNNTVTVDEVTRTIEIATDSDNSIPLVSESVTAKSAPTGGISTVQTLITEDLGSVGQIADEIESQSEIIESYLEDNLSDGCRANVVQVSVLAKDANRKYVSPPTSLLEEIKAYLEDRKDVTHSVSCVSGFGNVIEVDMLVEVLVDENSIEDDVTNKIDNAIKKSDAKPYGILVEREFNKSLYISECYQAIRDNVEDREYDFLNVVIQGPSKHVTGYKEGVVVGTGNATPGQTLIKILIGPVVPNEVILYVNGVEVARDDGLGELTETGGSYGVTGTVDYSTGELEVSFANPVALADPVTADYYTSLIDRRGNLICPSGYVFQAGTITINKLQRTL